jgi:hypothetical protein
MRSRREVMRVKLLAMNNNGKNRGKKLSYDIFQG